MFNDPQKFKRSLFFIIFLQLLICTIISLAGCSVSDSIPSASILTSGRVTLTWEDVPAAVAYKVCISTSPNVTDLNSYKISNVTSPITITDLEPGITYYFVVKIEDDSGRIRKSKKISYTAIADTDGSIQFGNIMNHLEPNDTSSKLENMHTASPLESTLSAKPEKKERKVPQTRSNTGLIICFGDSLTFGTGASEGMDYPSQLSKMIGRPVMNKGIPGDTTASALRRLKRDVLSKRPDIVLITLGGNDLKNGVSKNIAFSNLKKIVQTIQKHGAQVIIGGLRFPGMDRGFGRGYEDLAQQAGALLIPDIFSGIVDNPDLMSDPIHPNNYGYRVIARRFSNVIAYSEPQAKTIVKDSSQKTNDIILTWDDVPNATSYNIYWSDRPGVNKKNGTKISNVKNPYKMTGLKKGEKYYFVVTAVSATGEGKESEELSFTVGQ